MTSPPHLHTLTTDETVAAAAATVLAGRLSDGAGAYLPGDDGYDAARAGYNVAFQQHPTVVVAAATAADVSEAVRFANDHNLPIVVQATGHGPGAAAAGGLLITTERMNEVTIDPRAATARVGAGVRWQQVIDAAAPHGLAAANGSSPGVGVVGYTLGGGLSPILGRTRGYAADNVFSIDLVTADGVARTITATSEPDLFWGLRGGKSGFGVVTAIEFRLFPLPNLYAGAPIRAASTAIIDAVGEMPYPAHRRDPRRPIDPLPVYERSALLSDLPPEAVDRLVDVAVDQAAVPVTLVEIRHLAGALRKPPREPNAVANRDAPFLLFLASVADADDAAAHTAFHERVLVELDAWTTGRTFANFLTPGDGHPDHQATAYPADVHARLSVLKRHWDPDGRFTARR